MVGGGHVEGFRRRGGSAGIDYAVCRDDRGLGATYSPVLRRWSGPAWGKAGWRLAVARSAWTPLVGRITIAGSESGLT